MASQAGGLMQDQNFALLYNGASVAGKANGLNSQRKGGLSGRKPLSDLSNSGKPVLMKASEKQTMKNFTLVEEATSGFKGTNDPRKKKSISKASERVQTGTRKALSDISNSGKPNMHEASKKKQNIKLSAVAEEPLHDDSISQEQFLHNHQECIKAQSWAMDIDQILKTVGLLNDIIPKELASPRKPETPPRYMEELDELPIISRSTWESELFDRPDSSPPRKMPKSPDYYPLWKPDEIVNFGLLDSP